jgi:hypothetical protein
LKQRDAEVVVNTRLQVNAIHPEEEPLGGIFPTRENTRRKSH